MLDELQNIRRQIETCMADLVDVDVDDRGRSKGVVPPRYQPLWELLREAREAVDAAVDEYLNLKTKETNRV